MWSSSLVARLSREQRLADETLVRGALPVPGAVRGEHLVDQHDLIADQPELELGVREDEPSPLGKLGGVLVERQAVIAQLGGEALAQLLLHLRKGDVLVVATLCFGRRREDRIGELLTLAEPWRHLLARQGVRLLVLLPGAAGKI